MTGEAIYYRAALDVWQDIDKIGAVELLLAMRGRITDLEGLVRFREFERDQAYRVLQALGNDERAVA